MKAFLVLAITLLVVATACQKAEPVAPVAPTAPSAPAVEPTTAPTQPVVADADKAAVDRYIAACKAGNMNLCAALKTKYGIEMIPTAP